MVDEKTTIRYCENCGSEILKNKQFCGKCGNKIRKTEVYTNQKTENNSNSWEKYLDENFKSEGTKTNLQDILIQKANTENSFDFINEGTPPLHQNNNSSKSKRQQRREENKKNVTTFRLTILLIVELIIIIIFGIIIWDTNSKLIDEKSQIISLKEDIKEKDDIINFLEFYKKSYKENVEKALFLDDYIVIVPNNTIVYHKYDCEYLDTSNFLAFNVENAKAQGYKACKHCNK